jgi:hypothetical protein
MYPKIHPTVVITTTDMSTTYPISSWWYSQCRAAAGRGDAKQNRLWLVRLDAKQNISSCGLWGDTKQNIAALIFFSLHLYVLAQHMASTLGPGYLFCFWVPLSKFLQKRDTKLRISRRYRVEYFRSSKSYMVQLSIGDRTKLCNKKITRC